VPEDLADSYHAIVEDALDRVEQLFMNRAGAVRNIRLHGDCHAGNYSVDRAGPAFSSDLDDCRSGPSGAGSVDCLLSGDHAAMKRAALARDRRLPRVLRFFQSGGNWYSSKLCARAAHDPLCRLARPSRWHDPAFSGEFFRGSIRNVTGRTRFLALREQCSRDGRAPRWKLDY